MCSPRMKTRRKAMTPSLAPDRSRTSMAHRRNKTREMRRKESLKCTNRKSRARNIEQIT